MQAGSRSSATTTLGLGFLITVTLSIAGMIWSADPSRAMQEETGTAETGIRIVHGIADAGPLDIYVDGVIALIGIVFAETSDELVLPPGDHAFAVVPTGSAPSESIAEGAIALQDETGYFATLLGTADNASVGLFAVDDRPPESGRARFRIVAGVADTGEIVPIFAGGDALSEPLAYGDASEYAAIDAGVYDFDFLDAASGVSLLALPQLEIAEGTTTDVILVGQVADATLQALVARTSVEAARPSGRAAQIVSGTCAERGDVVADLGIVQAGQGEAVGVAGTAPVAQGFGLAAVPFADLVASPHVVLVSAADGTIGASIACAGIGGQLTDSGALVTALQMIETNAPAGVAVLAPALEDPQATGVSIFLVAGDSSSALPATPEPATG